MTGAGAVVAAAAAGPAGMTVAAAGGGGVDLEFVDEQAASMSPERAAIERAKLRVGFTVTPFGLITNGFETKPSIKIYPKPRLLHREIPDFLPLETQSSLSRIRKKRTATHPLGSEVWRHKELKP